MIRHSGNNSVTCPLNSTSTDCNDSPSVHKQWYHYDHIWNVVGTSGVYGNGENVINMEAFGTVHTGGQSGGPRLTTKEYDSASGLYYFNARWYEKDTGRWIQKEPAGLDGPNWYHFNYNSPVVRVDPLGLLSENDGEIIGCATGFVHGPLPMPVPRSKDCSNLSGKNRCHCEFFNCMVDVANFSTVCISACGVNCTYLPQPLKIPCMATCTAGCGIPAAGAEVHCAASLAGCLAGTP